MASSNGLCLDSIVQLEERKCDIPKRNDSKSPFSTQCSSVLYSIIASSSDNPPFSSFSLEIPRVALETLFFWWSFESENQLGKCVFIINLL